MVGADRLSRRILGKGNEKEPMEVLGKETMIHERIEENLQEDHQKVDLMMKVIHRITMMKTTVVNRCQTRKRMWKDQTFLIRKKDRGLNLDPLVIIHPI